MQLILDSVPVLREEDRQDLLQVTPQQRQLLLLLHVCLNMEQDVIVRSHLQLRLDTFSQRTRLNMHSTHNLQHSTFILSVGMK